MFSSCHGCVYGHFQDVDTTYVLFERIVNIAANLLIVENEHLQEKSTLIGDASDEDPPTVKSERRLSNSRKESEEFSERECEN